MQEENIQRAASKIQQGQQPKKGQNSLQNQSAQQAIAKNTRSIPFVAFRCASLAM